MIAGIGIGGGATGVRRGQVTVQVGAALSPGSITVTPGDTEYTVTWDVEPSGGTGGPYTVDLYESGTESVLGSLEAEDVDLSGAGVTRTGKTNDTPLYVTARVSDGSTTEDTAQVSVTPAASTLLADLRWDTATGTTSTALTDGGVAELDESGSNSPLAVEAGSTYGWTLTDNCLSVHVVSGAWGHVQLPNLFPLPAAGQFWAVRYYMMNEAGQTGTQAHPHCHNPVGSIEIVHTGVGGLAGGDWNHRSGWGARDETTWPIAGGGDGGGPAFPWFPMDGGTRRALAADTWYRYEYIMHWISDVRYRVYPRLYNMAGSLLNDETSWQHSNGAGVMADYYANGYSFTRTWNTTDPNNIRMPSFGRGQTNPDNGFHYCIAAAAFKNATSTTDYIGAL